MAIANLFWVGGGSANTWAATSNTNWALTSGGSRTVAQIPTSADVATFDSNSGVGNSVIGASIAIQGLDCTGGTGTYAGTITHNTGVTLTINTGAASSLRLTSGMTYTPASTSSLVTFTNTSGTAQLTSAGKRFTAITINGAGGTVQQQDDLLVNLVASSTLTITTGIFDGNSHALTAIIVTNNSGSTRSLILGSSVTIGGNTTSNATIWNASNTTGLTFTKNSADITVLAPNPSIIGGWNFSGGGLTYNGLIVNQSSAGNVLFIAQNNTFSTLSGCVGWTLVLPQGGTTTVSTAPTLTGTQARPIMLFSSAVGGSSTLSVASGSVTLTWGALQAIVGSGGATFTATNVLDFGSNTGWVITPPSSVTLTPAALATAVWQDTTSGDFTVAGSIGKDLFVGGIAPGGSGGHFIAGTNAATAVTTALTSNVIGNVTGNLSGSVGSVTARVTANSDQIAGAATAATNLAATTQAVGRGTVTTGATTTSIPTSAMSPAGSVANQFGSNVNPRVMLFDSNTTTTALRGQATVVSASTNAANPTFTVNALTTAPANGDNFSIL